MKLTNSTYAAKPADFPAAEADWYVVDAADKPLGKVAVEVANMLRGKDRPTYTSHTDTGAFVVVVNAAAVKLSGAKLDQKIYYTHSGYIGNLKSATAREMIDKKPEEVVKLAVWGMMPKNKLSRAQMKKLKVYAGAEHPHEAQNPAPKEIN
jgi:large subunit ribosomal protein L13